LDEIRPLTEELSVLSPRGEGEGVEVLVSGGAGEAFRYVRRVREIDPESEVMVVSSLEVGDCPASSSPRTPGRWRGHGGDDPESPRKSVVDSLSRGEGIHTEHRLQDLPQPFPGRDATTVFTRGVTYPSSYGISRCIALKSRQNLLTAVPLI